ncbi:MAG TPA: class I SAM-dependent methyltransferase [Candidatus Dormibacteraeota bacterium]|nr:class I SAM-dependent methyltransferase [Candidatus Dormibacteraeota bacterium]
MSEADTKEHWEKVYRRLPPEAVSWYQPHLETSVELIDKVACGLGASIIDVGGGESTLVDDLLARGYERVTVLDISETAIDTSKQRLGAAAARVRWVASDVTSATFERGAYDVWHDRAVFHFLTTPEQRVAYVRNVARAVKPGGYVLVSTFGPQGPTKCSGLDVMRYDAQQLHGEFGAQFRAVESREEIHRTPSGGVQQFMYCLCRVE